MPLKQKLSEKCKKFLKKKISTNMREFKQGRFSSRAQAIAVSYSQMRKKYPECATKSISQKRRRSKRKLTQHVQRLSDQRSNRVGSERFDVKKFGELLDNVPDDVRNRIWKELIRKKLVLSWKDVCNMQKGEKIRLIMPQSYKVVVYKHDNMDEKDNAKGYIGGKLVDYFWRDPHHRSGLDLVISGSGSDKWIKRDANEKDLLGIMKKFAGQISA